MQPSKRLVEVARISSGIAPVVGRAGPDLVLAADEGPVLDPGDVAGIGPGEVGVRALGLGERAGTSRPRRARGRAGRTPPPSRRTSGSSRAWSAPRSPRPRWSAARSSSGPRRRWCRSSGGAQLLDDGRGILRMRSLPARCRTRPWRRARCSRIVPHRGAAWARPRRLGLRSGLALEDLDRDALAASRSRRIWPATGSRTSRDRRSESGRLPLIRVGFSLGPCRSPGPG